MAADRIWITWETQRRNRELARAFDCELVECDKDYQSRMLRYLVCSLVTLHRSLVHKPRLVIAQCPSLVLVLLVALLRKVRKFVFVIDAHNAAFEYNEKLVGFAFRTADFVIVSNQALTELVRRYGGTPLVLPDRLPEIPTLARPALLSGVSGPVVTLVSTFAPDEPIALFVEAAANALGRMPFTLFVTGRRQRAGALLERATDRIQFTDYLRGEDFEGLIQHSDLIVDLTTRENCLVCGAYEALAVGVPTLLSDSKALRETFGSAAVFSANSVPAFEQSLTRFFTQAAELRSGIPKFREAFRVKWEAMREQIESEIRSRLV